MGIKETANTFHISRNTVRKYVRLFISSGKPTDQLLELTEEQLRDMFGCTEFRHREPSQRQLELDALIPDYVARLSRKGMTVRKLFNEYRESHPDGFQESVFRRTVRQYRFHTTVVGHVEHYAADRMYIDFAGDRLAVVDEMTGEVKKAEVFVAILPFSHYLLTAVGPYESTAQGRPDQGLSERLSVLRGCCGGHRSRQSQGGGEDQRP